MKRKNLGLIDDAIKDLIWKEFLEKIKKAKSAQEIRGVINKFFTSNEIEILEKRLAIVYFLNKKLSYRKIGEIIWVSPRTISFVKNGLKRNKRTLKIKTSSATKISSRDIKPSKYPRYPTFTGRGRWRFLNTL
jgi:uncharacterized protein YerC